MPPLGRLSLGALPPLGIRKTVWSLTLSVCVCDAIARVIRQRDTGCFIRLCMVVVPGRMVLVQMVHGVPSDSIPSTQSVVMPSRGGPSGR
eukprot:gene2014-3017_t